ncbi:MAG: SemiSWEET transporter [Henriciella sp.]|nr:SemiSWEET transporter [Henriciella sp.]
MHELIGLVAAILTTASFVPQAVMVVRTGDTAGISLIMYIMFTVGVAGWTSYGLLIGSFPVIAANVVTLVLATLILVMKLRAVMANRRFVARA